MNKPQSICLRKPLLLGKQTIINKLLIKILLDERNLLVKTLNLSELINSSLCNDCLMIALNA